MTKLVSKNKKSAAEYTTRYAHAAAGVAGATASVVDRLFARPRTAQIPRDEPPASVRYRTVPGAPLRVRGSVA